MQLSTAITGLIAAAAWSSALPAEKLVKREVGGADIRYPKVLICHGPNATGTCTHEVYSLRECHNLPPKLQRNASTFAPDGEDFFCFPRAGNCSEICTSPTGCTFGAVDFHSPRKWDLSAINWQHLIGSFDCYLNKTTS
ncbi:hypothetical protein DL764_003346 [Monosporascus ibericus]|uniref:Uncharacterized protein n=1 Tax=Monosporascus ibericus TaxID=155417 RepID=A0A4Q4TJF7_9PEZI|nr:hypothetical protein DL764_003346 [Monosporascus ibericus]